MPVMDNGVLILSLSRKIVRSGRSYQESFVKCVFFLGGGGANSSQPSGFYRGTQRGQQPLGHTSLLLKLMGVSSGFSFSLFRIWWKRHWTSPSCSKLHFIAGNIFNRQLSWNVLDTMCLLWQKQTHRQNLKMFLLLLFVCLLIYTK